MYGLTKAEIDAVELNMAELDALYAKFIKEEDQISGVLDVKLTKKKNVDFRLKLDAWRARKAERKNYKNKRYVQNKTLREKLAELKDMVSNQN